MTNIINQIQNTVLGTIRIAVAVVIGLVGLSIAAAVLTVALIAAPLVLFGAHIRTRDAVIDGHAEVIG